METKRSSIAQLLPILVALACVSCDSSKQAPRPTEKQDQKGDPAEKQQAKAPSKPTPPAHPGASVYANACANCHGPDRLGLLAPPLIPKKLKRYKTADMIKLIDEGRFGTRMPPFGLTLTGKQIADVADFIQLPAKVAWSAEQVKQSRQTYKLPPIKGKAPARENVTAIVERGTGNILFIEDFKLATQVFFPNVHGGLKYHGDKLYIPARTGFIVKVDLPTLKKEVSVRSGIYLRNIEIVGDRLYAACSLPPTLVTFDMDLNMISRTVLPDEPTSVIRYGKDQLLVTQRHRAELLLVDQGKIVKTLKVPAPFHQLTTFQDLVIGTNGKQVFLTDLKQQAASIKDASMPHIAAGEFWRDGTSIIWATPKIDANGVTVYRIEQSSEQTKITRLTDLTAHALPVKGHASTFVRTHPNLGLFATTSGSDVIIGSKKTLRLGKKMTPAPGKMALHTEFSRDGKYLFISVWDPRGGIYIYSTDDLSLKAVIPASRPAGQYNRYTQAWRSRRRY